MRASSAVLASILALGCADAESGPFGFQIGAPVSGYNCKAGDRAGYYVCTPPKPHSAFQMYAVQATPSRGICFIKGVGKDIRDNGYGIATKSQTDQFARQIDGIYGPHSDLTDFLAPGSIWDDADDWLFGIVKQERSYIYEWEKTTDPAIAKIYVAARATSNDTGYVAIEYHASFSDACDTELEAVESQSL